MWYSMTQSILTLSSEIILSWLDEVFSRCHIKRTIETTQSNFYLSLLPFSTFPPFNPTFSTCNIMAEGFRFMPLGFSWAENLSAQCMGYLGTILTQVFTGAREADVSLRDVTMAQMGNGASKCEWCHAPEARRGFGDFLKKSVSSVETCLGRRQVSFACSRRPWAGGARDWGGGRWKIQNRKNVYLSPNIEEPLNSKVIKNFVPELRSRKYFSCFEIPMFYVIHIYEHYTSISRIAVSGYGTSVLPSRLGL